MVDVFFCMSGFLLSYFFFKSSIRTKPFKIQGIFMMIINRIIRLIVPYVILILFSVVLLDYLEATNVGYITEEPVTRCEKNWWRNILFISNLYPRSEMCLSWSWYLGADMQFYVVSVILLFLSLL